jgi:hypothetical protein
VLQFRNEILVKSLLVPTSPTGFENPVANMITLNEPFIIVPKVIKDPKQKKKPKIG